MTTWAEKEAAVRALEHNGKIDPLDLIEAAKSPDHPCHEDFTWDVEQAAQERWRDQAREIIRRVKFEVTVEEVRHRVVMYVPNQGEEHLFQSMTKVRTVNRASQVLGAELAQLLGLAARVYGIAIAKQDLVGADVVVKLKAIVDTLEEMKAVENEE